MMSPQGHPTLVLGLLPGVSTLPVGPWNQAIRDVAAARASSHYVDLMAQWPVEDEKRARLMGEQGMLSPRGHAMVGAHVCRAVQQALTGMDTPAPQPTLPANEAPTPESE